MKTLVVYETFFGNTEKIARAIASSLGPAEDVAVFRASDATSAELGKTSLLVVGSPTRAFRPTPGVTKFLKGIPRGSLKSVAVAAFDTRISPADVGSRVLGFFVRQFGYAAGKIADRLRGRGGELVAPAEGFLVAGAEGPLKPGEIERAAAWGRKIAEAL